MERNGKVDAARISLNDRNTLLALARESVETAVKKRAVPLPRPEKMPGVLDEPAACFVTVCRGGELRGCIGHLEPRLPLWLAVRENAAKAATHDPRFLPIGEEDLRDLQIEISVLSPPRPVPYSSPEELLSRIRWGRDGVILEAGDHRATFLPQVWEKVPDPEAFFDNLADKACGRKSAWRDPSARVWVYGTESFGDTL